MTRYLDISIPTGPHTTVYPGDPPSEFRWPAWSHDRGDPGNVGYFYGSLHHGTHADAPWHFVAQGKRLDEVPLDRWVGPCWVADLTAVAKCITAENLENADIPARTRRLLFKTTNSQADYWLRPWDPHFIYLDRSAAIWCVERGLWTVGIDYLTVDPLSETEFPAHCELLGHDVVILENLCLRDVVAGSYELLAAPIKLEGVDAGWCRALLRAE